MNKAVKIFTVAVVLTALFAISVFGADSVVASFNDVSLKLYDSLTETSFYSSSGSFPQDNGDVIFRFIRLPYADYTQGTVSFPYFDRPAFYVTSDVKQIVAEFYFVHSYLPEEDTLVPPLGSELSIGVWDGVTPWNVLKITQQYMYTTDLGDVSVSGSFNTLDMSFRRYKLKIVYNIEGVYDEFVGTYPDIMDEQYLAIQGLSVITPVWASPTYYVGVSNCTFSLNTVEDKTLTAIGDINNTLSELGDYESGVDVSGANAEANDAIDNASDLEGDITSQLDMDSVSGALGDGTLQFDDYISSNEYQSAFGVISSFLVSFFSLKGITLCSVIMLCFYIIGVLLNHVSSGHGDEGYNYEKEVKKIRKQSKKRRN